MNREILFRGFHPDENGKDRVFINGEWISGEWIEGNHLYDEITDKHYIVPFGNINESQKVGQEGCCYCVGFEVIPETVGQYTGLTDKNDKKIFENNYCLLTKPCVMAWGVIKYKNACYWFVESKTQADGTNNMIRLCDLESNGYEIQVKGNIHDNPELLEVAE